LRERTQDTDHGHQYFQNVFVPVFLYFFEHENVTKKGGLVKVEGILFFSILVSTMKKILETIERKWADYRRATAVKDRFQTLGLISCF